MIFRSLTLVFILSMLWPTTALALCDYRAIFDQNLALIFDEEDPKAALPALDHVAMTKSATDMRGRSPTPEESLIGLAALTEIITNKKEGEIVSGTVVVDEVKYGGGPQIPGDLEVAGGNHPGEHTFYVRFNKRTCRVTDVNIGIFYSLLSRLRNHESIRSIRDEVHKQQTNR